MQSYTWTTPGKAKAESILTHHHAQCLQRDTSSSAHLQYAQADSVLGGGGWGLGHPKLFGEG